KNIYDPPVGLFAKGNLDLLDRPMYLGIVGSRKASPAGLKKKAMLPIAESYHILKDLHRESLNKNTCNPMQIYGFSEKPKIRPLCLIK
ncbi:DNA-processing protein DprA, partial [Eubacterium callanderi]|uniref:DNA-processing protein DprA n=1 Tax=Eubacterium callanderi TaxID=53442 RepID=UPI00210D3307